jgi:hypothetical protein
MMHGQQNIIFGTGTENEFLPENDLFKGYLITLLQM